MANTSGGSSMDGAGGNMASGNDGQGVISSSHSGSGHMTKVPSARRRAHPLTRLGSEVPEPSQKKRKVVNEEEAPCGVSNAGKISAPSSAALRDPNGTSSSEDHAGGHTSEYATVGNVRGSPIKRRCMRTSRYLGLFTSLKGEHTDEVVKSKQSTVPTKTKKVKESQFQKLQRLPDGCHPDFDNDHLCSVNKLLEFRHKSQGAVFVDDKEHVMKTIFFISSVLPDACHSFLLVTTSSLPLWKAEFNRFAPSINIVVFYGEKDVLKLIQNPEFLENGSHTMLHVLLAHPDVILEDIKSVEGIVWESVIVDYCQDSVAKHLKQLKQLPTYFRMVLLSSPLKDSLPEYKKLLDFLNSEQEDSGDYIETDSLAMLRARFTRHIAYERKAGSSKFLEYWVPAYLSQVQLELYSSILLANSSVLQSQMTTDSVGALCDVVMSLWKCCNHPCLIDLQHSLANTRDIIESTEDRMCVSGKLLLLEKMLKEIRNKSLRVIVLFQSDGAVGDRMGNILEDLVRHKFGPESYERVQNRSAFAMKQEAMNMFNDTTKGRFVFLIDSRACQPSINLSSIDSIIIYGSDLSPLNDLKALRKLKIGSQLKYVRIFRLYTPFTVEEKSLVLAKQSMVIDSNIQYITSSLSHCLVSWGVSFLFNRVDELQQDNCASKSNERGTIFMDKVILEFLTEVSTEVEDSSKVNSTTISKACMSGEFYSRNITLIGEKEGVSSLDGDPPKFWLNLLDGKSYCQHYKPIEVTTEETNTSRRKLRNTCETAGSSNFRLDVINHDLLPEISTPSSADLHLLPETGVENLSTPKSLHAEIKHELSKLMMVLKLPDNVHFLAKQFLEYLLKNHLVVREPRCILHAFNIALCWRAASFLKYTKLDHRESLALASDGLKYECSEELSEFFYKEIGILKEKVAHKPGGRINDRLSPHESSSANLRSDHNLPKQAMDLHGNFTNGTEDSASAAEKKVMVSDELELVSAPDAGREQHLLSDESPSNAAMKRIDLFNSIFSSRERDIIEKQELEILNLRTQRDNQVNKLKEVCHAVVQHIRTSNIDEEMKIDQIKLVIQWFTMFMHSFLAHMRLQFFKLDALHSTTLAEEQLMKEKLKHEVISGELDQFPDPCITLPDSNSVVEEFIHFKKQNGDNHVDKKLPLDGDQLLDDRLMEITIVRSSFSPEACPTLAVRNEPTEAHMRSGGRAASESVDLPDNNNHCSSDGIDYQRACSASSIPTCHDSINQESSTGDGRSIEHAKGDIIANPSMFPGSATSLVGINAENDSTVAADPDHMELPILASPQNVTTLQHPTAEEPSDALPAMAAQDLQTEMQTPCPTLGAQHQKVCPDDSSKMNHEPDTATGVLQEGTTSDHLGDSSKMKPDTTTGMLQEGTTSDHLDDSSTGIKEKNIYTVAADPLNSESRSYIAPNNPAVVPEASVAETQSDQSSMPAQHSPSLPTQRKLPISGHPPEEADPSSNLDTEAAQQPDIQPSSSTLDADSSETRHQPETTTVLLQGGSKNHDVDNDGTVHAQKAHSESPILAAPQSSAMLSLPLEVGTPVKISSTSSLQSNDASSGHTPAVSESPGMLGTQAEQDLHRDMRPSTSLLDVPLQRMFPDDRSQTGCRPDRGTDLSEEGQTEYLTCTTSNLSTLPFSGEAETENGQASMPAQEITSPHVQHSLATSQHPVGDLQPPTLILSEEAERAGLLCTSASQDLQPSVTIQEDVPLERTDLSGMSMTQRTAVQQSVEPSSDPHAEEAGTSGMLSAPDLQSGMRSSSPLQDQLAEAEGAGISGTVPAQNLQPETQPSTSAQNIPPERTHPDERIQIGLQPNTTSGPEHLAQLSTVAPASLLCSSEPLINELEKLKYWNAVLSKNHEQKKSQLQTECNQEIEKVKEKYELLLQEEDSAYHRLTTDLNRICTKVFVHQSLAKNFQKMKESPVQERSASPTIWQAPQSSQHAPCGTTAAQTTLLPVASSLATRPPVLISSHTTGPYLQPSQVARPPASGVIQLQPVLPGNLSRAAPSPVGSMPPRNGIYAAVGAQSRGPAPHLQQLRMPAPCTMVRRDEQQPSITNPGFVPSRQSSPGMFESSASGNALAGIPLTSMAPSSVHQAMPSASNSHPAFPASSLLPGSGPEPMANFAQSNSRIPVAMASQQAPGLNPAFHHMGGGPLNTESRIQQALAHIGGTAQAARDQSQEVLRRLLQRLPQVMAPSSVQPTAPSSHPAPMAARQQAGFPNPAPDNMAGPLNAAAGVRNPGVRIGSQSYQVSTSLLEWEASLRVGLIRGHPGTYPQGQGGADLTGGPPGTSPQGSSGASREVVCLSDDEE